MVAFSLCLLMLAATVWLLGEAPNREQIALVIAGAGLSGLAADPLLDPAHDTLRALGGLLGQYCLRRHGPYAATPRELPHAEPTIRRHGRARHTTISRSQVWSHAHAAAPTWPPDMPAAHSGRWPALRGAGQRLGERYLIIELVAITSYHVYHALDCWTGAEVAIKQCRRPTAATESGPDLLEGCLTNEAAALRRLAPGLAPAFVGLTREGPALTLITGWLPGRTVRALLAGAPLAAGERLALALQICHAVAALHAQAPPLLHNDLKPENLIQTPAGQIVPIDFGLAHPLGQQWWGSEPMGTPPYTAPEQWRGELLDLRADVFALGMVLRDVLAPLEELPGVHTVLDRATASDRQQRTVSIDILCAELQSAAFFV